MSDSRSLADLTHDDYRILIAKNSPIDVSTQLDEFERLVTTGLSIRNSYTNLARGWAAQYKLNDDRVRRLEQIEMRNRLALNALNTYKAYQLFIHQPLNKSMSDQLKLVYGYISLDLPTQVFNFSRSLARNGIDLLDGERGKGSYTGLYTRA